MIVNGVGSTVVSEVSFVAENLEPYCTVGGLVPTTLYYRGVVLSDYDCV